MRRIIFVGMVVVVLVVATLPAVAVVAGQSTGTTISEQSSDVVGTAAKGEYKGKGKGKGKENKAKEEDKPPPKSDNSCKKVENKQNKRNCRS